MFDTLGDAFGELQQWLFESAVQPLVFSIGLGGWLEDAFDATGWLLIGLLQLAVMVLLIGALQRWRPVEAVRDRRAIRTDILYSLIHKLGLFRLFMFLCILPLYDAGLGWARQAGWSTWHLDQWWPGVTDRPWVSLLLYLLVFDFVEYAIHVGQHRWRWWWSLHAVHHSQRQMTLWSDDRNHLLDDLLHHSLIVLVAQLIGVPPMQFVLVLVLTQLSQSLQHANVRLSFGRWGQRLWVSPAFHRTHHAIGVGHEGRAVPGKEAPLGGCNYGVLLPWWDMLFGTANFSNQYLPTGIRDQVQPNAQGRLRDYGRGFWAQQWLGLRRLLGRG